MRKAKTAFLTVIMAALAFGHAAMAATDAEIKARIRASFGIEDNGPMARRILLSAIDLCEGDTNRFESVLCSLAEESLVAGDEEVARGVVWDIGRFGTTNSLPFLYGCATNAVVGGEAVLASVKISGISSNVVDCLSRYLSVVDAKTADRAMCCYYFLENSRIADIPSLDRRRLADCLAGFAPETPFCVEDIDSGIIMLDPAYRYSRRRLAVARTQSTLMLNEFGTNYVNSVINELVAYPESALGD